MIDESTLINMGPSHAEGYFRGPGTAPHNLYNTHRRDLAADARRTSRARRRSSSCTCDPSETFAGDAVGRRSRCRSAAPRSTGQWNPETGKFDRAQNGTPHVDKTYGQIAATNVVVMGVEYQPSPVDAPQPGGPDRR